MAGYLGLTSENSLGKILGCKVAFCSLFPYRKAQVCGGEDSVDGGHGHRVIYFTDITTCPLPMNGNKCHDFRAVSTLSDYPQWKSTEGRDISSNICSNSRFSS